MTKEEILALMKEQEEHKAAEAKSAADAKVTEDARVDAAVQEKLKELAKTNRKLSFPLEVKSDSRIEISTQYDDMKPEDLAFLAMLRASAKSIGRSAGPSEELLRTLAAKSFKAIEAGKLEAKSMQDAEFKANEVMQSTLSGYGDQWVFSNLSTQLWQKIRDASRLVKLIPEQEIPRGYESDTIPLESTDFTFYNMAQAADVDATTKEVLPTVTSSQHGTGQRVVTVGKLGAKGIISGELDEDSIIDAIPNARRQLEAQLPIELEFLILNMDSTTATDNVNGNGTPTSGADYMIGLGMFRLGLKTNTANKSDLSSISTTKIATLYSLLGNNGLYVYQNPGACAVFVDGKTWLTKLMIMSDLLTQANAGALATINRGAAADGGIPILGVPWYPSSGVKLALATGIRNSATNAEDGSDTLGRCVLVRPDQWILRWKRRAKFETQRVIDSDTTKIVVSMRFGLGYFDTDAAAVGYNIT